MIDFTGVKSVTIPEGVVKQITRKSDGTVLFKSGYTNQVPRSLSSGGGSIYNGTGYKNGYRLSSNGSEKSQNNSTVTGFIPAKPGDVIRMKGVTWGTSESNGYCYILYAGSDFKNVFTINKYRQDTANNNMSNFTDKSKVDLTTSGIFTDSNGVTTFIVNFNTTINYTYIRISAEGNGANMIVTVNEEIE